MTALQSQSVFTDYSEVISVILDSISGSGYVVLDSALDTNFLECLFMDIKSASAAKFHAAGVGRYDQHRVNQFVRKDRISWLDTDYEPAAIYFDFIEQLRQQLNRELYLGLFDYECHYAHYPKGAFYKKHLDAFNGQSSRRITTILYLNPDWQQEDGGELVLYNDENSIIETVLPAFGKLVVFLSDVFPHEVLPAGRSRYSLTGWFRINNTTAITLDPAR